jgi:Fe2+ transport system protein FeoA
MLNTLRRIGTIKRAARMLHDEHETHCTSLCCGRGGQRARVLAFDDNCGEAARLREMGVREGATVTVMRDGDPLLVRVDDARFGISRQSAMQIFCTFLDN